MNFIIVLFAVFTVSLSRESDPECGDNAEHKQCMPDPKCHKHCGRQESVPCNRRCYQGCMCKEHEGFLRQTEGPGQPCIHKSQCGQENVQGFMCGEHETFNECGSSCEEACDSSSDRLCTMDCRLGCFCAEGYVRQNEGDGKESPCIRKTECDAQSYWKK